jgi:hypothetical protein
MKIVYFLFLFTLIQTQAFNQVNIMSIDAGCSDFLIGTYPNVSGSNWEKSAFQFDRTTTITIAPTGVGGTWTIIRTVSRVERLDVITLLYTNPSTSATPPTSDWKPTTDAPCPTTAFAIGVVLPIELIHFKAQNIAGQNQLIWQTASEKNSRYFDIERSADGSVFQSIGTVKAMGDSKTMRYYAFQDQNPPEQSYYRLKINDLDGKTDYSKIVFVDKTKTKGIKISKNTEGALSIETDDIIEQVTLTNAVGQVLKTDKSNLLLMDDIPMGIYIISVKTDKGFLSQKVLRH